MTRRLVALPAALVLAVLAGCTPTASPSLDLSEVLTGANAPERMTWVASGAELTAGADLETISQEWAESAGEPAECLPLYLVPYGVQPGDEDSADRTVEIGYFEHEEYDGSILVNGREFPTDRAATDYLQHALRAAGDCPGYSIDQYQVGPDGFAVARFEGGHGLSLDGGRIVDGITSRTAVVQSGRTIVLVDAFLLEAVDFDPGVVDELARTVLDRLGAST